MKKIVTMIGIASLLCLFPECKKSDMAPQSTTTTAAADVKQEDMATMRVLLDSKPCVVPQKQYTSASVDIRGIKVFTNEHGWEALTPVAGAWDVVSLQTAPVPIADITEQSSVHAGTVTKIALTFGDNNKLVVNNATASCYKIGAKEVVLDLNGQIRPGTLNELVVSIDICGNISVQTKYDQEPCYTLNPVMAFASLKEVSAN